jgi:hypothetical protein
MLRAVFARIFTLWKLRELAYSENMRAFPRYGTVPVSLLKRFALQSTSKTVARLIQRDGCVGHLTALPAMGRKGRGQELMGVARRNCFSPVQRVVLALLLGASPFVAGSASHAQTAPARTPPSLGTIKSITADTLTLTTDSGTELKIQLPADVKAVRVPPGAKDLKEATAIQITDLQPGDRILVRTKPGADGSSLVAASIVAMSKTDIAAKQQKEREDWQRHGIGGLVSGIDAAQNTVTIKTLTASGPHDVAIHIANDTILRRYAPGSVNFDEAKVGPLSDIQVGDQLRARGTRSADGNEFTAAEVVSGSFRNIAGLVTSVDASAGTLTVNDLATKKPVELKVTTESQMRKLPERVALGIAMRLKGTAPAANGSSPSAPGQPSGTPPEKPNATQGAANATGNAPPGGGARNGGDMQQMLSRLPASPLTDFQKGDAVMIVATAGQGDGPSTVITLLGGVEPILQATSQGQAASILSPWSLSQGGGGDMGTP